MTNKVNSPLRQRMIEDMTIRGFTACTQRGYIAAVRNFTVFLGRSPDRADKEDLRRFQLHMRSAGASAAMMNAAVSALGFFFGVTLGRGDAEVGMTTVRLPQRLPVILSPQEVARLLDNAPGLKSRAALSLAYGAGLRASEVVSLKLPDIPRVKPEGRLARAWRSEWNGACPGPDPGARAARTVTPCCRTTCSTCYAPGGARDMRKV